MIVLLLDLNTTTDKGSLMNVHRKIVPCNSTGRIESRAHAIVHTLQPSRSSSSSRVEEDFRPKANSMSLLTTAQQKRSDARKSQPLVNELMRKLSAKYSTDNEVCRLSIDCDSTLKTSRSLQDISTLPGLNIQAADFDSDSDGTTFVTSPLYENLPAKVPLSKSAMMTNVSRDTTASYSSTSSVGTAAEEIYDNIYDLAAPKCYTAAPAG